MFVAIIDLVCVVLNGQPISGNDSGKVKALSQSPNSLLALTPLREMHQQTNGGKRNADDSDRADGRRQVLNSPRLRHPSLAKRGDESFAKASDYIRGRVGSTGHGEIASGWG